MDWSCYGLNNFTSAIKNHRKASRATVTNSELAEICSLIMCKLPPTSPGPKFVTMWIEIMNEKAKNFHYFMLLFFVFNYVAPFMYILLFVERGQESNTFVILACIISCLLVNSVLLLRAIAKYKLNDQLQDEAEGYHILSSTFCLLNLFFFSLQLYYRDAFHLYFDAELQRHVYAVLVLLTAHRLQHLLKVFEPMALLT